VCEKERATVLCALNGHCEKGCVAVRECVRERVSESESEREECVRERARHYSVRTEYVCAYVCVLALNGH